MKRILLVSLFTMLFVCFMAMAVSAQGAVSGDNTYYVVMDEESQLANSLKAEGKQIVGVASLHDTRANITAEDSTYFLNQFDGQTVNLVLAENISYTHPVLVSNDPYCSGLRLEKAITLNLYFNNYYWWIPNDTNYASISVCHSGATLNFIGNRTPEEISATINVSDISATNKSNSVDFYGGYVGVYVSRGQFTAENVIMAAHDEAIYQKNSFNVGDATLKLDTCAIFIKSANCYDVRFESNGSSKITAEINNLYTDRIRIDNVLDGGYIKNSTMNELAIDTYFGRNIYSFYVENSSVGSYYSIGDSQILKVKDSTFGSLDLKGDSSGGAFVEMTDSKYSSVNFQGKSGQLTVIKTATCVTDGTKVVYTKDGSSTDDSYVDKATGHTLNIDAITNIVYASYLENGTHFANCKVCGAENIAEKESSAPALFVCLGYSAYEVGGDGIAIGYLVNDEAIDKYTSITGKDLSYGVFVASQNKLGENDIFDQEGNKTGGVVSVEITSYEFAVFELKVVGFTDENKGSLLAMGAYVKEVDGENAEYSYMQDDTNGEKLGNYYFVSYDSIVSSLS